MAKRHLRPIQIVGNVALVTLTRGYTAIIDVDMLAEIGSWNWQAEVCDGKVYAKRLASAKEGPGRRGIYLHRAVFGDTIHAIDHINGDGLDNRRENLREATAAQNAKNRRLNANSSSGLKGVTRLPSGRWQAQIASDGVKYRLGTYTSKTDAHSAYVSASIRLHGEYGNPSG